MGTDGLGSAWLSDRAICAHLIHAGRYLWAYLQRPILRGRYDGRAAKPAHSGGDDPDARKVVPGSSNLGKLVVSSIRLMMAMNLGHTLEGSYADVIATKATNSPAPYII